MNRRDSVHAEAIDLGRDVEELRSDFGCSGAEVVSDTAFERSLVLIHRLARTIETLTAPADDTAVETRTHGGRVIRTDFVDDQYRRAFATASCRIVDVATETGFDLETDFLTALSGAVAKLIVEAA